MHRTASLDARAVARRALQVAFFITLSFLLVACSDGASAPPPPPASVAQVVVTPAAPSLEPGETLTLTPHAIDNAGVEIPGRAVAWSSTEPDVATVTQAGVVTAMSFGTATIRATIDGKIGVSNVTVILDPVASLAMNVSQADLHVGATQTLVPIAKDINGRVLNGRAVVWSTSNPGAVSVNYAGLVTAIQVGTSVVTATVEGFSASATVSVTPAPVASVIINPTTFVIEVGEQKQLQAFVRDPLGNVIPGRQVLWTVDAATVRITQDGLVTGLRNGYVTVFATTDGITGAIGGTIANPPPYDFDLVYSRLDPLGQSELFVLQLGTGTAPTKLNAGSVSRTPTASPDGSRVAFAVSMQDLTTGQWIHDIFAVDRNGMNMKRLTSDDGYDEWPEWSPLGDRIVYQHYDPQGRSDIWVMKADGTEQVNLTSDLFSGAYRSNPTWSRDASRIAFAMTYSDGVGTTNALWVMNADGSAKRELTNTQSGFDNSPSWSPDGNRLAFVRYYNYEADITILDLNSGAMSRITLPGQEANPSWSPDGSLIAFTSGSALYTVEPNGTNLRLRSLDPSWGGGVAPTWISRH